MIGAALRAFTGAGGLLSEFWRATPWQTYQIITAINDVRTERFTAEMKLALSAAWHGAVWGRVKRIDPLDTVLSRIGPKRKADSPERVAAAFRSHFGVKE